MYSPRLGRNSLGALAALVCLCTVTGTAYAATDPKIIAKCSGAIIKAGAAFVQAEAKILQKCRDTVLKGKTCDTTASIGKAREKLRSTIVKACQGKDKSCNTLDADGTQPTLNEIHWDIEKCPNFEGGTCTDTITDCDDIPLCIQCIGEASVNQAIDLYYPPARPVTLPKANKVLNKCQATIGKAAVTFLAAKSKALAKCWGAKIKKPAETTCPDAAQAAIDAARAKFDKALVKPCPGLSNSTIGLPDNCPAVTPEGGAFNPDNTPAATCSGGVSSLINIGNCVTCVTEFKVDCPDRVSALSVGATYPSGCNPSPTPTPTPAATATATPTPTAIETPNPLCGNGALDPDEDCDPTAGVTCQTGANTSAAFTCSLACHCACPTKVTFAGDPLAPESILDTGWTGISHRAPIISDGQVTVALSGCSGSSRPCGVCNVTGPVANPGAGTTQIDSQRCTNNNAKRCTSSASCGQQCYGGANDGAACTTDSQCPGGSCPAAGTCEFFFGSNLPLAAGGVTACVVNQFNGPVTGTANVESGEAINTANLTARVYTGPTIDHPCVRCIDDTGINDGGLVGTCEAGVRVGLHCDSNGTVPGRPDFGETSLDCPIAAGSLIAALPIDLSNETNPVTKTLSASSPACQGAPGERCLCDTCNNANQEPCSATTVCPSSGGSPGVCGGKRCLGGTNAGAPCAATSACPSAGICGRPGTAAKPSACLDDTTTVGVLDCTDTSPVDGEGECTNGPADNNCSVASGHAQRGCLNDAACGGGVGTCVSAQRNCFLTGGFAGSPTQLKKGTDTLIAVGMEDAPMGDTSDPTLGAVFCVGPTGSSAINDVSGLPGPGRVTIKGHAVGLP